MIDKCEPVRLIVYTSFARLVFRIHRVLNSVKRESVFFLYDNELKGYRRRGIDTIKIIKSLISAIFKFKYKNFLYLRFGKFRNYSTFLSRS